MNTFLTLFFFCLILATELDGFPLWGSKRFQNGNLEVTDRNGPLGEPTEMWKFEIEGGAMSSPVIGEDGTPYIRSNEVAYSINQETGDKLWESIPLVTLWEAASSNSLSSCQHDIALSADSDQLYVSCSECYSGSCDIHVIALDTSTGDFIWDYTFKSTWRDRSYFTVDSEDRLYFAANWEDIDEDGIAVALDKNSNLIWNATINSTGSVSEFSTVVVNKDSTVVCFSTTRLIECFYGPNGEKPVEKNSSSIFTIDTTIEKENSNGFVVTQGNMEYGFLIDENSNLIIAPTDDDEKTKFYDFTNGELLYEWENRFKTQYYTEYSVIEGESAPVLFQSLAKVAVYGYRKVVEATDISTSVGTVLRSTWEITDLNPAIVSSAENLGGHIIGDSEGVIYMLQDGKSGYYDDPSGGRILAYDSSGVLLYAFEGEYYFGSTDSVIGKSGELYLATDEILYKLFSDQPACPRGYTGSDCQTYNGAKCCNRGVPLDACGDCQTFGITGIDFKTAQTKITGFIQEGNTFTSDNVAPATEIQSIGDPYYFKFFYTVKNPNSIVVYYEVFGYDYECEILISTGSNDCLTSAFNEFNSKIQWEIYISGCNGCPTGAATTAGQNTQQGTTGNPGNTENTANTGTENEENSSSILKFSVYLFMISFLILVL